LATLELPWGRAPILSKNYLATVEQVKNVEMNQKMLNRVESKCWLGKYLVVRGVIMNAIDHSHGRGEECSRQPDGLHWLRTT